MSLRAALCAKIETSLEHGASEQEILERLQNKLDISPQIAKEYFDKLSQPIKQFAFANNLWYNVDVGEMGQLLTVLSDSADSWICGTTVTGLIRLRKNRKERRRPQ